MIPYCNAHGIGLIPWGPLHAGDLARPVDVTNTTRKVTTKGTIFENKWTDADVEVIKRVNELAAKKGWKPGQVSLAWINKKVSSPIVGVSSVSQKRAILMHMTKSYIRYFFRRNDLKKRSSLIVI